MGGHGLLLMFRETSYSHHWQVGSCNGITVLSVRSNKLTYIPDEIGRIPRLRVLNLSDNLLQCLPYSIVKLKELQALWLTENQTRPLIPLQSEHEPDTGRKILTCYLLPQSELQPNDEVDPTGDTSSFHASMWDEERLRRQQIHFDFGDDSEEEGTLVRCPTPYPKEMRAKVRHARNLAMRQMVGGASGGEAGATTGVTSLSATADVDSGALAHQGGAGERSFSGDQVDNGEESFPNSYGYSMMADRSDIRIREARITSSTSPSSPSHRLYRADKDKQNKDKARMQHRNSVPDFSDITGLGNDQQIKYPGDDFDVNGTARRSGSVPDLSVTQDGGQGQGYRAAKEQGRAPTFDELYSKHMGFKHQPHRSHRRGRRSRGYDSDTGYKSDRDVVPRSHGSGGQDGTSSEILSVRSQPTLRRSNGYASDFGPYSSPGVGTLFPTANAAAAAFQQNRTKQGSNNDLLFSQTPISTSTPHVNRAHPRAKTPTNIDYDFYNHNHHHHQQQQQQQAQQEGSMGSYQDLDSHRNFSSNQNMQSLYQHNAGSNHISESYQTLQTSHPLSPPPPNQEQPSYPHQPLPPQPASASLQSTSQPGPQVDIQQRNQQKQQQLPQTFSSNGYGPPPPVAPKPKLNFRHGVNGQGQGYQDFTGSGPLNQSTFLDVGNSSLGQGQEGSRLNFSPRDARRVGSCNQGQTNQATQPRQTPPPYTPAPPYQRKSSDPMTNSPRPRLPSNASSGSGTGLTTGPSFFQHGSSSNPSLAGVERSQSSPCGFHGSNPYTDFPGTSSKGSDNGGCGRGRPLSRADGVIDTRGDRTVGSVFHDNMTTHSGSSSSHIGSASQIGGPQNKKLIGSNSIYNNSNFRSRDRSDSSDSRSDSQTSSHHLHHHHRHLHNQDNHFHDSSNNSYSDGSRQHQLSSSFDTGHNQSPAGCYEDFTHIMGSSVGEVICNPEQSSQVSSSTDSGYGPGHNHRIHNSHPSHNHVYESIGDDRLRGFPGSGSTGSHASSSSVPHTPPSQRQTPTQGIGRPNSGYNNINTNNNNNIKSGHPLHLSSSTASNSSREATPIKDFTVTSVSALGVSPRQPKPNPIKCKEYRKKLRVTIKKNPDLGFSIAGGIGQGNRYRVNDIGIFVSKVIPDGPASKLLMTGDKLLEVNEVDFQAVEHHQAVQVLKTSTIVNLVVERIQKVNMV